MTIPLPYGLPASSQLQLVGFRRITKRTGAAGAFGGVVTATFDQLGTDELWLIDRAVISCTSTSTTSLRLYDTTADPNRLLSGSDRGSYDEADYPGGLLLEAGNQLVAVWSGASAGAVGTISVQVREFRRAS